MRFFSALFLAFNLCSASLPEEFKRSDFINEIVENKIVISTSDIRQELKINAVEETPLYILSFVDAEAIDNHLLFIQVKSSRGDGAAKQVMPIRRGSDGEQRHFYLLKLGKYLSKGDKLELEVKLIWSGINQPYPKEISQRDMEQKFEYFGNAHFYSPYPTTTQKLIVNLPTSREPASWQKSVAEIKPVSRSGSVITYGPYTDVKALSILPVYIHYFDSNVPLVAEKYTKSIRLSYWTPELHVEEDFELFHRGAKLKGFFSQIDYKLTERIHGATSVVKSFTANLPVGAKDVYYKDAVGNISTSNLREEKKRTVLEMRPRYPLYGGWKFSWFIGYTITMDLFVKKIRNDDYKVEIPLLPSINNLLLKNAQLKVVLPEGATNVKVYAPFPIDNESHSLTFTYFDTIGRPTVLIEKHNVIDEFSEPIKITYTYTSVAGWRKPIVILLSFGSVLLVLLTISNLDLSIIPDPKVVLKKRLSKARAEIGELVLRERQCLAEISNAFSKYKADKDLVDFNAVKDNELARIEDCHDRIEEDYRFDPTLAKNTKGLATQLKKRLETVKKMQDAVVKFFSSNDFENEAKRRELSTTLETLEKDLKQVSKKIASFLTQI